MKYEIFLKNGLAGLCLAGCSMAAQATLFDIDELSGYINIQSLNHGVSGVDTAIGTRNVLIGGSSNFALGANDFSVLSATFNNMLTPSGNHLTPSGNHYSGGSFGWTVFNRGQVALDDIRFYILLVAGLSKDNLNVTTTGGGSAGDYFEIGSFNLETSNNTVLNRLILGTTPSNAGPRTNVTTNPADKSDTMQYALGRKIGSLAIDQGFEITYRFGNTGLFGKNTDENNAFYLDVDTPRFIPEPGSLAIMSFGLMALLTTRRRFKLNKAPSTAQT